MRRIGTITKIESLTNPLNGQGNKTANDRIAIGILMMRYEMITTVVWKKIVDVYSTPVLGTTMTVGGGWPSKVNHLDTNPRLEPENSSGLHIHQVLING